jgi:hypothetical protein
MVIPYGTRGCRCWAEDDGLDAPDGDARWWPNANCPHHGALTLLASPDGSLDQKPEHECETSRCWSECHPDAEMAAWRPTTEKDDDGDAVQSTGWRSRLRAALDRRRRRSHRGD